MRYLILLALILVLCDYAAEAMVDHQLPVEAKQTAKAGDVVFKVGQYDDVTVYSLLKRNRP